MKRYLPVLILVSVGCGSHRERVVWHAPTKVNQGVRERDLSYVLDLAQNQPELNKGDWPNSKPLAAAISLRQSDIALALIQRGAETQTLEDGSGPLQLAIGSNEPSMIKLLLKHGSGVGRKGFGEFPIHTAASSGNVEIIRLLLEAGADPNTVSPTDGSTPLELAVRNKSGEAAVRVLLAAGAKPEIGETIRLNMDSDRLLKELKLTVVNRWFDQSKYLEKHPEFRPKDRR